MNSDGSNLQQLTTDLPFQDSSLESAGLTGGEEQDCNLKWSSDEKSIVFTGRTALIPPSSNRYNVYKMGADGSNVTQLTDCHSNNSSVPSACVTPNWSPDRQRIVFSDDDGPGGDNLSGNGLYTINPDGTGLQQIYTSLTWHDLFPHYSTDGQKIFFTSDPPPSPYGIWSINTDGTGLTLVISGTDRSKYLPQASMDCSICQSFGTL